MKVFKFGGGTLINADAIRKMSTIVNSERDIIVVVSAFSKMTSAFESLLNGAFSDFEEGLQQIEKFHFDIANDLLGEEEANKLILQATFNEVRRKKSISSEMQDDELYDLIVSYGELLSSTLISEYWNRIGLDHELWDARSRIITDSSHKEGQVLWTLCEERKEDLKGKRILTQGFIGATTEGSTTTLGREGSDYSAAIFGSLYNASEVVVWKDVPGIMTADPSEFDSPGKMDEISYLEAVELSYFGAKVIHPNTIKPLQNKGIPLIVKSLYSPDEPGTRIIYEASSPPEQAVIIKKANQVLVSIQPRDFSFIVEDALARIFKVLSDNKTRINLMQHGAVSISLVFDWDQRKLDKILGTLLPEFKILYNTGLELWTIRHYTSKAIDDILSNRRIYVQQKSRKTARFVLG